MKHSSVTYYPVDNGAMALLQLNDNNRTTILIDMHIRAAADDPNDDKFDAATHLRDQLKQDSDGRPYVDVFLLSHNDDDHIKGLRNHFHLGSLDDYSEPKDDDPWPIVVHEIWGTSRFWTRSSKSNKLCDDAKAFNKEMKRRTELYRESGSLQDSGDRVLILGADPDGKTDGLEGIVQDIGTEFSIVNGIQHSGKLSIKLMGPLEQQDDEEDDDFKKANRGSAIVQLSIVERSLYSSYSNQLIFAGDAEVLVWESLWSLYGRHEWLEYDLLLAPHHCSWRSLSWDSESDCDNPQLSTDASQALGQSKDGAHIISSSKPIYDDGATPPSILAKQEYCRIIDSEERFLCTAEIPTEEEPQPIVFNLTSNGPQLCPQKSLPRTSAVATAATGSSFPHG